MKMLKKHLWTMAPAGLFLVFVLVSVLAGFLPGKTIGKNFVIFFIQMLKILPCIFILIGLFDVWVKPETVERHLGQDSGAVSYLWALLLASTIVGGLYVAIPVAHALYVKRARLGVVVAFLSAAGICRIPMTLFEASFLGWRFTCVRFAISLPLVIISSAVIGYFFDKKKYTLPIL